MSTTTTATAATSTADGSGGTTTIDDGVVAKIAGIAARSVPGVHDLGGAAGRAIGAIRNRINQTDLTQGISVEVGETQVAVDVALVAEYPTKLQLVADEVRTAIIDAVESYVGMEVTVVNVSILDVHMPSDDDAADDTAARVQ